MRLTAHKTVQEPPMSDTRHLADLKFDERPLSRNLQSLQPEGPQTDMMMLQKADVWMSQFKTRLNISIIGLVVLWGAVSYYKSTGMQLAAHPAPESERILADGSIDEHSPIPTVEVDSLQREMTVDTVEAVETVEAESKPAPVAPAAAADPLPAVEPAPTVAPVKTLAPAKAVAPVKTAAPAPASKKIAKQKTSAQKAAAGKNTNRNSRKLKKSVASKPAP